MNKSYDLESAASLIPLLRVLNREIRERSDALAQSIARARQLERDHSKIGLRERTALLAVLRAEISTHKREIRETRRELGRLGCLLDEEDLATVHIPGRNGEIEDGFVWHAGASQVEAAVRER